MGEQCDRDTVNEELYRFAIQEGIRTLQHQDQELSRVGDRVVALVGLTATATAFLIGAALQATTRGPRFFIPLSLATLFFLALLIVGFRLLTPVKTWAARISGTVIVEDFASLSGEEAYRMLATFYDRARNDNEKILKPLRSQLRLALALSGLTVLTSVILVWLVAS